MNQEDVIKTILKSDELPTLPTVASQLITLTSREDTTLADIGNLVAQDISISAKILKVSNSAFYSFPQQIGSIKQAVSILGMNAVRSLVLSFSFLTIKGGKQASRFDFKRFWERSLASAVASRLILENVKGADTEQIFISGLLQNLGELILAKIFPEQYDEVLAKVEDNQYDLLAAEESVFGINHTIVGTEIARSWGFPAILTEPIQYHHNPSGYEGKDQTVLTTVRAVYLSDLLVNILFSEKPEKFHQQFRSEAAKLLRLTPEEIENILEQVHIKFKEAGTYFNLKIKSTKSVQEILQEANIKLSLINLDYDQMNKQLILAKIHLENLTKELENKNEILDNLANLDGLTGAFNHRYFQNALEQEISRCMRNNSTVSILLLDIDHFKKFNDTYGHQVGDFVLTEFTTTLKNNVRKYDMVARYGGEEFIIILPETNADEAINVAEKLRVAIESADFDDGRESYNVTASFGVSSATPAAEEDFNKDTFINQADQALYQAKEKGRNKVVAYSPKKKWYSL
ncbi:MAG: two-component system cell cycle response regulator [Desulforhopalus sp.]|jgi:two-component system cell cycle response regulator